MDAQTLKTILRKNDLFNTLHDDELDVLIENGSIREFLRGKIIYMKGEKSNDTFCLILSGSVNIVAAGGDILKEMGSGEVIGEIALSDPHHIRTVNVIAKEPTLVLEWNVNHIKGKIPVLWKKLLKLAWKNIRNYYEE
ncbi:cAMP-binding protein [Candidatus Vecturithrix granuli]|uniref:cAMP-binding protein n=1 Tax=Vecturithrix granuli TaxID=1499967 RepID=A0A081BXI8_VECG1|nr:cAMP-binding protein [Candidatus Vecturithrix granuli]